MNIQIVVFVIGIAIVLGTIYSALRSFVLPRGARDPLTGFDFFIYRTLFNLLLVPIKSYTTRDRILAYYAPIALLTLVPVWFILVTIGYMLVYWALGIGSWFEAFRLSGSSLLTLGFATSQEPIITVFIFSEATLGLMMVALLIAYLPTIYSAFSRRENAVRMLEVRAGNPPSSEEMILRFNRIHGMDRLTKQWAIWENWFADIEESHTSLAGLVYLRSHVPGLSWITAAGTVLDAASLKLSVIEAPQDPQAALCIRSGYLALRQIADFYRIQYPSDPKYPDDPISITRVEFEETCDRFREAGIPLKENLDQSWIDFAGWRVNYDTVLLALADLTDAPEAQWITDQN